MRVARVAMAVLPRRRQTRPRVWRPQGIASPISALIGCANMVTTQYVVGDAQDSPCIAVMGPSCLARSSAATCWRSRGDRNPRW